MVPLVAIAFALQASPQVLAQGFTPSLIAEGQAQAQQAVMPAAVVATLPTSKQPPQLSPAQLASLEAAAAQTHRPGVMGAQSPAIAGPVPGANPAAPGSFITLRSKVVTPVGPISDVMEPSVGQEGGYVFYTGNWFAARSICGGEDYGLPQYCDGGSWQFIDPSSGMPDFCCDQDVIPDPRRQNMLWYRQGIFNHPSGPANQNRFILGVSWDAFGPSSCYYDIRPTTLNAAYIGSWFDYPQISVSNDSLWIVTNMFNGAGAFLRTLFIKMPLDGLYTCGGFGFSFIEAPGANGWASAVQGTKTQMYFGSHKGTNNSMRVYWWNEDSGTLFWVDRAIPAFTFQNRNSVCAARPAGSPDWTNRGDSRLLTGWYRLVHPTQPATANENIGQIGFMWHANQGGGFAQPYVEAATFRTTDLAVSGRPFVWSGSVCWQYPGASPNSTDDLGIAINYSSAGQHVSTAFLIDDDFNGVPPGWENYTLRVGNTATPSNRWGDFIRSRPYYPSGRLWASTGWTMQGGTREPRYYVVGRSRDELTFWKYQWSQW